jgi:CheY-like chemotaxis protein
MPLTGALDMARFPLWRRIDVVLTDIELAGRISGWDVAEQFRAARADVLIIYTSGNSADRSRRVPDSVFFDKPTHCRSRWRNCIFLNLDRTAPKCKL